MRSCRKALVLGRRGTGNTAAWLAGMREWVRHTADSTCRAANGETEAVREGLCEEHRSASSTATPVLLLPSQRSRNCSTEGFYFKP